MAELVLIGNANTGKTTLFNRLTRSRGRVSNWNGVTVECKKKTVVEGGKSLTVFDLPGIESLCALSKDEAISVDMLERKIGNGSFICVVCDAANLTKNLRLAVELKSRGINFDIVINMINEVGGDVAALKDGIEKIFGCKCFLIDARKKRYTSQIKKYYMSKECDIKLNCKCAENAENMLYKTLNCVKKCKIEAQKMERTEKLLLNKFIVLPLFFALFGLVFWLAFGLLGNFLSSAIERIFVDMFLLKFAAWAGAVNDIFGAFVRSVVVFGVGSVVCFLPQILILYVGVSLLEEVGLLARVAFVLDPFFRKIGLSGRSVFSLLSGFGCTTSAVLVTRNLESAKIRKRTTLALPFFGCSAKLPVLLVVASLFFEKCKFLCVFGVYLLSVCVFLLVFSVIGLFSKNKEKTMFVRLPRLRRPNFFVALNAAAGNFYEFFRRTFVTIFLLCCGLFLLNNFSFSLLYVGNGGKSMLQIFAEFLAPVFLPLGFGSWGVVASLLFGLVAKEMLLSSLALVNGCGIGLLSKTLVLPESVVCFSAPSSLSFLVFVMLFTPCIPSLRMIASEISGRWAAFVCVFQFALAYLSSLFVFEIASGSLVFLWILIAFVVAFCLCVVLKWRAYGGLKCHGCYDKNCSYWKSNKTV